MSFSRFLDDDFQIECPPLRLKRALPGMRFMMFSLLIASACATAQPRTTANIPAIRHQINDTIAADASLAQRTSDFAYEGARTADPAAQLPPSRKITAMGRVTSDRAVVYTQPEGVTLEETWVRAPDGWKLTRVKELDTSSASASR
jgi:uncharacterized protein RhaS with RHS repeats